MPSSWTEANVTVADTTVHYYRGGEGPPLLLLHGDSGNPGWLMHHEALAQDYTVYAPSHPGFGRTPRPEWITRVPDMSLFYLWLLDELGLDRLHVLGHSFGGWLAADIAATCPQIVDRLVLVDAVGVKPQNNDILDIFLLTPEEVRDKSYFKPEQAPEWERLYGQPATPDEVEQAEDALETLVRLCWKPYMHDPRLPAVLKRVKQPALVIWGREDAIVPLECGKIYSQCLPASQLLTIEACGHTPQIENPQRFADAVLTFLRSV